MLSPAACVRQVPVVRPTTRYKTAHTAIQPAPKVHAHGNVSGPSESLEAVDSSIALSKYLGEPAATGVCCMAQEPMV